MYEVAHLETLTPEHFRSLRYDPAGQLVLYRSSQEPLASEIGSDIGPETGRSLSAEEQAELRWALYWLHYYEPEPNSSDLERVRGYLEAFYHLCQLQAWAIASQVLSLKLHEPAGERELHQQLGCWGYYRDQKELYESLLHRLDTQWERVCLQGLGTAHHYLGQLEASFRYYQQLLQLGQTTGDRKAIVQAKGGFAQFYFFRDDYKLAEKYGQEQLKLARELGDRQEEAVALLNLGKIYDSWIRKVSQSLRHRQQGLEIARELGDRDLEIQALGSIGAHYANLGQQQKAISVLKQHLCLSQEMGNRYQQWHAFFNLSKAYYFLKEYETSQDYLNQSLAITREFSYFIGELNALQSLGSTLGQKGQYQEALQILKTVWELSAQIGYTSQNALTLVNLSYFHSRLHQCQVAKIYAIELMSQSKQMQSQYYQGMAWVLLGYVNWQQHQYIQSLAKLAWGFWLMQPWADANGQLALKITLIEIGQKLWQQCLKFNARLHRGQ